MLRLVGASHDEGIIQLSIEIEQYQSHAMLDPGVGNLIIEKMFISYIPGTQEIVQERRMSFLLLVPGIDTLGDPILCPQGKKGYLFEQEKLIASYFPEIGSHI